MKRQTVSIVLSALLSLSFLAPRACNEDQVKRVKQAASDLLIYSDAALHVLAEYKAANILPAERADRDIRFVTGIRTATQIFIDKASGYEKFDAAIRGELLRLFQDVVSGVRSLHAQGFSVIKDEQRRLRISTIVTGLLTAAQLIESRLR
jgi:hypothetical protein